jgi:hypothetical protein
MAEIILPIEEPKVTVEQLITESVEESIEAPQPGVVIGILNRSFDPSIVEGQYTGALQAYVLPEFQPGYIVYDDDTLTVSLTNNRVKIAEGSGTIPVPVGDEVTLSVSQAGQFLGVARGDIVELEKEITTGTAGVVTIAEQNKLTEAGAFVSDVVPNDILVVGTTEYTILTVAPTTVVYVTVDGTIPSGTGISWSVKRQISTNVLSNGVTNTTADEIELDTAVANGSVTYAIYRDLTETGTSTGDQPLASSISLAKNTDFTLVDGVNENDSVQIVAFLNVDGFSNVGENLGTITGTTATNQIEVQGVDLATPTARLAAGDIIYFTDDSGNKYVRNVVSATWDTSSTNIIFDGAALADNITTAITPKYVISPYKAGLATPVGGTGYTYTESGSLDITQADVEIGYTAKDIAPANTVIAISRTTDLDQLGEYEAFNELRVAAQILKANAGVSTVYAIPLASESVDDVAKALEIAEGQLLYSIVLLSQSFTNQSLVKTHVDSLSTPSKGAWRVAFMNLKQPVEEYTSNPAPNGIAFFDNVVSDGSSGEITLSDPQANFADVRIGHFIRLKQQDGVSSTIPSAPTTNTQGDEITQTFLDQDGNTKYERIYKVSAVVNSTKLKLELLPYKGSEGSYLQLASTLDPGPEGPVTYVCNYEVFKVMTKDEVAQAVGHVAQGFSDRRVNYVTNETCIIEFTDADGNTFDVEMPGYMYCAALAGLVTSTFPHQPLTRVPLVGIKGVRGGREEFSSDQLGVMAAGGGWNIVQDVLDASAPYTWRQLTTSQGGLKEKEFSFTKNLDEISYALVFDHSRFPGRNNRVPRTLAAIDAQTRATLEGRKTVERNSITGGFLGTQIINYTLSGAQEDPLLLDTVYSDITLELPLPLNSIKFRVIA